MGAHAIKGWVLNPDDPRAPSAAVWALMTEDERAEVVASLPAEPPALQLMGEGDVHYDATDEARKGLRRLFGHRGRSVYVGTGMTVYYPDESPFSPDIFAVLDVETHPRKSWVVAKEGRGLDFVLEVCVSGDRSKDTVRNVVLYASLGIREYFVLLPERQVLFGHRLGDNSRYVALAPHHGRLPSEVLDLELALDAGKVRFFTQGAPLPFQQELVDRLEAATDAQLARVAELEEALETEGRAREDAERARDEERRAREEAERQLGEAREALARLTGKRP
jgi:hypothetical protein